MEHFETEREKERAIVIEVARAARRAAEEKQAMELANWQYEVDRQRKLAAGLPAGKTSKDQLHKEADFLLAECQKLLSNKS